MYRLCHIDDIPEGESKGLQSADYNLFAVKKDGEVFVYQNSCPHLGIDLEWQEDQFLDPDGALIQCSTHGAIFEIHTGECISGPCIAEYLQKVDIEIDAQGQVLFKPS